MEKTTSGLSVTNVKKLDLKKCAVCQNVKDKRGDKKLTSTEKDRENLFRCSLGSNLLRRLSATAK